MASAVTLKDEIQHGATHADMVAAVFGCSKITVSFKEIARSTVAIRANISSRKAVESYNSRRY